tara:strand:- start:5121 stop:5327 length:207 start_codon:yes stop_codon:yes gene_type:complete
MQKLLKKNNINEFLQHKYDEIVMLGVNNDLVTIMSTCKAPELTTAILEFATEEAMQDLFPHMRGGYVH